MKKYNSNVWYPLAVALAFIAGLFCALVIYKDSGRSVAEKKLANILHLIDNEYVDEVNVDSLIEEILPTLLSNLDPHSVYIPPQNLDAVNQELEGSFGGVGISFNLLNDTIQVIEIISGGPADRVGMKAGDRIIKVDGIEMTGKGLSTDSVFSKLRGPVGTEVTLTVKRNNAKEPLEFLIERDEISVTSIDAEYMASETVGYIKVNKFGRTTYDEFWQAMCNLSDQGATDFIIDLRDNTGGLLETAVLMANEFMPRGLKIVETIGRHSIDTSVVISDGTGSFQQSRVIVLINEFSASSSEIFAGAIQDNDRGLIIGRRSFGKGLVQHQIDLDDHSAVRLTVARYYTPSGRCIQKSYGKGHDYENDIFERISHGELFAADSIHFDDNLRYQTLTGRTVYGGGGIMPDIFVPNDTTGYNVYYQAISNGALIHKYAMQYTDINRDNLEQAEDLEQLLDILPSDGIILRSFVEYAKQNGVPIRWYYINLSADRIVNNVKALIVRNILGTGAFYRFLNDVDKEIATALEHLASGDADFPVTFSTVRDTKAPAE